MSLKKLFAAALISSAAFGVNAAGNYGQDDLGVAHDAFSVFDANNDGKVSMTEVIEAMIHIVQMDKDGDHFISEAEAQATDQEEGYNHWIAKYDTDNDGRISAKELPKSMMHMMDKMDKNNDGYLTADELNNP